MNTIMKYDPEFTENVEKAKSELENNENTRLL